MTIRLLVVDDHPLMRMGVLNVVSAADDIEAVGECPTDRAKAMIASTEPSVVIVGAYTKREIGCVARLIKRGLGVVLVDENQDPDCMLQALEEGFSAYVSMSDAPGSGTSHEIIAAIRHADVFPTSFAASGLAAAIRAESNRDSLLSTRERQVLMLIRDGHSSSTIAERLGVSDSSVKTYVTRIYSKLEVSNRSQALVAATGRGLLPIGEAA